MDMGERILNGLIVATAVILLYFTVEVAIESVRNALRHPPSVAVPPPSTRREFWWRVFPGNGPTSYFEIHPEEGVEGNQARFEEWINGTWNTEGRIPEEWWEQAMEQCRKVTERAIEDAQEMEIAAFRKSLEDL